ncbi:MAG: transposase [Phycisphaeraceae bacterium]|nr:transposase [Phycisphaeraceae bacterium]
MSNYRRNYIPGATYFFTVVTANRQPIFDSSDAVRLLSKVVQQVLDDRPFTRVAGVVLPDHLHAIWTLPASDLDYSTRWAAIKAGFTRQWLADGGHEVDISQAQKNKGSRGVWQPRFMEHTIRDEDDFSNHVDYIHWNPVKHGYVKRPIDWPWSSLHRFVREGKLPSDWGCVPGENYGQGVDSGLLE